MYVYHRKRQFLALTVLCVGIYNAGTSKKVASRSRSHGRFFRDSRDNDVNSVVLQLFIVFSLTFVK